jgi:predicted lactoylglutathione lyase
MMCAPAARACSITVSTSSLVLRLWPMVSSVGLKPAVETFWGGYAGYFQDPDGHLWEVLWNPDLLPDD